MSDDEHTEKRDREWCFTLNNYSDLEYTTIKDVSCRYLVIGKEVGDQGTPHLQGYVVFPNAKTLTAVKKLFKTNRVHLKVRYKDSSPLCASNYCKKDGDFFEKGELPKQGKRTDLDDIREVIKKTNSMRQVVDVAKSYQSVKMAEQILKYHEAKRQWKPFIEWFYGSTGTGKSHTATKTLGKDHYCSQSTGRWWDGYDAHDKVLLDEYRADFMKFHDLLRLLDRYEYRIEHKGGTRQFLAKHIIITSAYHPSRVYYGKTNEDIQQLLRRIDHISDFDTRKQFKEVLQQLIAEVELKSD
jgi:hypothetical protein